MATKKKTWNADKIMSISAIMVSLFTLFILIYQSNLLMKQFELAQKQQYASVLPYLEIGPSWTGDSYKILLQNTGIGPAFIKDVYVEYDGKRHELDLFGFLSEFSTPDDGIGSVTYSSIYPGRVLQAGSSLTVIETSGSAKDASALKAFFDNTEFGFGIEYASVYDERWLLSNLARTPVKLEKE